MYRHLFLLAALCGSLLVPAAAEAAIRRDPNGVNVNSQGSTSLLITFGGLDQQVPVEATWCGALVPAAPDLGFRCDPTTIFGRLPLRFDQSRLAADGSVFTDIMSIPASVTRRAYQAAERGEDSQFFYVRRFVSLVGGPDEYVFVTCRMAGGGARTPLSLVDVTISFDTDVVVPTVLRGSQAPALAATIGYTGTGRLRGRWEIVTPADQPPSSDDLLTEASLPPALRGSQRRYPVVERFDVFLPPTGKITLAGPDPARLPTEIEGIYQVLLRIEASNDKEGDSNLALAGAGTGIVHAGAVAGFPMPVARYSVGSSASGEVGLARGFVALAPSDGERLAPDATATFAWSQVRDARLYRLEVRDTTGVEIFAAVLQQGIGTYRALTLPAEPGALEWRVVAIGPAQQPIAATTWRGLVRAGG